MCRLYQTNKRRPLYKRNVFILILLRQFAGIQTPILIFSGIHSLGLRIGLNAGLREARTFSSL